MKKYFRVEDDEHCYPLKYFKQLMKAENIESITLIEGEIEIDTDYFYCREFQEVGIKGEGTCGTTCEGYSPRNGKNGRCKHSTNCYTPTDKEITIVNKSYVKAG